MLPLAFVHLFWKKKAGVFRPFPGGLVWGFAAELHGSAHLLDADPAGRRGEQTPAPARRPPLPSLRLSLSLTWSLSLICRRAVSRWVRNPKKKKMIATTEGKERAPMFSSWSFMVSGLTFESFICFELVFVCGAR